MVLNTRAPQVVWQTGEIHVGNGRRMWCSEIWWCCAAVTLRAARFVCVSAGCVVAQTPVAGVEFGDGRVEGVWVVLVQCLDVTTMRFSVGPQIVQLRNYVIVRV